MIDFSKAPEGATHYDDSTFTLAWWTRVDGKWLFTADGLSWVGVFGELPKDAKQIPNPLTVTCDNERQKMLCEQVIRMERGKASQYKVRGQWLDHKFNYMVLNYEYRAKPKKELVVPWEWIDDKFDTLYVNSDGDIDVTNSGGLLYGSAFLKLDLTDIELPVTVKRPEGK